MSSAPIDNTWMDDAACRDQPVLQFTDPAGPNDIGQARRTCLTCPVREPCLNVALARAPYADPGIWGGTTPAQRRQIRDGRLTITQALDGQEATHRTGRPPGTQPPLPPSAQHDLKPADHSQRRPSLAVDRDRRGDYVDESGRVIIFRIFGEPPYMLMIDDRPIARTATVAEAAQQAWAQLHGHDLPGHRSPEESRRQPRERDGGSPALGVSHTTNRAAHDSKRSLGSRPTSAMRMERAGRGR